MSRSMRSSLVSLGSSVLELVSNDESFFSYFIYYGKIISSSSFQELPNHKHFLFKIISSSSYIFFFYVL